MSLSCLFVGFGQISSKVFASLASNASVALRTDVFKRSTFVNKPKMVYRSFCGDVADYGAWDGLPRDYDVVVFCVTPSGRKAEDYRQVFVEGLKNGIAHLSQATKPAHIVFVSSTSVYAQDDSGWLDETSEAQGGSETSKVLLEAESLLRASDMPSTIVRFSGIYGGARTRLIEQVVSGQAVLSAQERWSNRIHEVDAVGFICHLLTCLAQNKAPLSLYNVTDSEPCDMNDVYHVIAEALECDLNRAFLAELPKRRTGNKRINNQRMRDLGYQLAYPTFREGYAQMCHDFMSLQRSKNDIA